MSVELLYFEGCPSYEALLPELRALLASEGINEEVELRRVETIEDAKRERFLGPPPCGSTAAMSSPIGFETPCEPLPDGDVPAKIPP